MLLGVKGMLKELDLHAEVLREKKKYSRDEKIITDRIE